MQRWIGCCVLAATLASTGTAFADRSYSFSAIYKSRTGGKDLQVTITEGQLLPAATDGYDLDSIQLDFKKDVFRDGDVFGVDEFTLGRKLNGVDDTGSISWINQKAKPADAVGGKSLPLFSYSQTRGTGPVDNLTVDIRARYDAKYICAMEYSIRRSGAGKVDDEFMKPPSAREPNLYDKLHTSKFQSDRALMAEANPPLADKNGAPILYSFCTELNQGIDWKAAADAVAQHPRLRLGMSTPPGTSPTAPDLLDEHKRAAAALLAGRLPTLGFGVDPKLLIVATGATQTNLAVQSQVSFSVIKDMGGLFTFTEIDRANHIAISHVVDQASSIWISAADSGATCEMIGGCEKLFQTPLTITFETKDKDGNAIHKALDLQPLNGKTQLVKIALTDFLEQSGYFQASIKLVDTTTGIARTDNFTVKNLGLITSFPVASEIAALVSKFNSKDQEGSSTIPIAWAVNFSNRSVTNIAVQLPWMLSYNTRHTPDLSKYFSVFAHISLVVAQPAPGTTSSTPSFLFATGVGFSIAQILQISWAVTHTADQFLLIGLNVPGLVKLGW